MNGNGRLQSLSTWNFLEARDATAAGWHYSLRALGAWQNSGFPFSLEGEKAWHLGAVRRWGMPR
jgi:hypothetical protein